MTINQIKSKLLKLNVKYSYEKKFMKEVSKYFSIENNNDGFLNQIDNINLISNHPKILTFLLKDQVKDEYLYGCPTFHLADFFKATGYKPGKKLINHWIKNHPSSMHYLTSVISLSQKQYLELYNQTFSTHYLPFIKSEKYQLIVVKDYIYNFLYLKNPHPSVVKYAEEKVK
jgi:hypothetical protein